MRETQRDWSLTLRAIPEMFMFKWQESELQFDEGIFYGETYTTDVLVLFFFVSYFLPYFLRLVIVDH